MVLNVSLGWYSDKHIEQVLSLAFGNRRLSPSTIFGYDSIVGPSRPATRVACCGAIKVESCVLGWRIWISTLARPLTLKVSQIMHNNPSIPTHMIVPYLTRLERPKRAKKHNNLVIDKTSKISSSIVI